MKTIIFFNDISINTSITSDIDELKRKTELFIVKIQFNDVFFVPIYIYIFSAALGAPFGSAMPPFRLQWNCA